MPDDRTRDEVRLIAVRRTTGPSGSIIEPAHHDRWDQAWPDSITEEEGERLGVAASDHLWRSWFRSDTLKRARAKLRDAFPDARGATMSDTPPTPDTEEADDGT